MTPFLRMAFDLHQRKRTRLVIILCGFIIAFAVVRLYSIYDLGSIFFRGYHLHHFYFGAFIMWLGGIIAVLSVSNKGDYVSSAMIGVGTGLFADEIGLLLNCTTANRLCLYAFPNTTDVIGGIIFAILALMVYTGYTDYRGMKRKEAEEGRRAHEDAPLGT